MDIFKAVVGTIEVGDNTSPAFGRERISHPRTADKTTSLCEIANCLPRSTTVHTSPAFGSAFRESAYSGGSMFHISAYSGGSVFRESAYSGRERYSRSANCPTLATVLSKALSYAQRIKLRCKMVSPRLMLAITRCVYIIQRFWTNKKHSRDVFVFYARYIPPMGGQLQLC